MAVPRGVEPPTSDRQSDILPLNYETKLRNERGETHIYAALPAELSRHGTSFEVVAGAGLEPATNGL